MRRLALTLALAVSGASDIAAQSASAVARADTVMILDQEWMAALQRHDVPVLERLMAPDFALIHPSQDSVSRKANWLAYAARFQTRSFRYSHPRVVRHGPDLAIVSAIFILDADVDGRAYNPVTSIIDVWERREGRWQIVTRYATRPEEIGPRSIMMGDEMKARKYANVYEAIRDWHPDWLGPSKGAPASTPSGAKVGVFYTGERVDLGLDYLRGVMPDSVANVRYMTATQSASAYGPEWQWGAIVLTRR